MNDGQLPTPTPNADGSRLFGGWKLGFSTGLQTLNSVLLSFTRLTREIIGGFRVCPPFVEFIRKRLVFALVGL